jgi:hypothetical protein
MQIERLFKFFSFAAVSNKLRQLSTTTDILSVPPTTLQEEAEKAIVKYDNKKKA